ncbi:MAG: hypothetical protein ACKOS8_06705 [Gemmataceae bacterium]
MKTMLFGFITFIFLPSIGLVMAQTDPQQKPVANPPERPVALTGKHTFKTFSEITDPRILNCLPLKAKEISIVSERGGHFARYKIGEADFMKFQDYLWEASMGNSAHKRGSMESEGEPVTWKYISQNFKASGLDLQANGWEPLENAILYYGPSKKNGAITAYFYDRKAGVAYHSAGYW